MCLHHDGQIQLTLVAQNTISDESTSRTLLQLFQLNILELISNPDTLLQKEIEARSSCPERNGNCTAGDPFSMANNNDKEQDFQWTTQARTLRSELSILTSVDEDCIQENMSIFDFGLDSIDAIKLSSRLRRYGIRLSISKIMQSRTIARMVREISNDEDQSNINIPALRLKEIQSRLQSYLCATDHDVEDFEDVNPATGLQESMVAKLISSKSTQYWNHELLRLRPNVDLSRLMRAWETVIRGTPILRTSFIEVDDPALPVTYAQVVHRYKEISWDILKPSQDDDLDDIVTAFSRFEPNAILKTPPFALKVIHHNKEIYLNFSIAHALYDGWCLHLLHEDVHKAYFDGYNTRPPYAPALGRILKSTDGAASTFWKSQLSGVSNMLLPSRIDMASGTPIRRHYHENSSYLSTTSLQGFCKSQGVTQLALCHTCWALILACYTGRLDVVFGTVLAGRDFEQADQILFPTMNTVTIRSIIHGTRREMLQYMTELNLAVAQFQHFPLRIAQTYVSSHGESLFNTLFIFQKRPESMRGRQEPLYTPCGGTSDTEVRCCPL